MFRLLGFALKLISEILQNGAVQLQNNSGYSFRSTLDGHLC